MAEMKKIKILDRNIWIVLILLISMLGAIIVLYNTIWGAALSDDSYYYISSARNLLAGHGFDLVANFPPLLPLILSFIGIFRVDPLESVRWLNAFHFVLNIWLVARILFELTRSYRFSLLGALMMLVSSTMIMVHSWAMSEALFISLTLWGILIYTIGHNKRSWKVPLITGLLFGLAVATRYIGVALLIGGGIAWLFEGGERLRSRIQNVVIFSIVGIAPLIFWLIRNQVEAGEPTNRVFEVHLMPAKLWISMLNTILLWVLPGRLVHGRELFWLGFLILMIFIALMLFLSRKRGSALSISWQNEGLKPIILICLCIITYVVILIISRSFFDIRIPMDERLLSPILVMGMILFVWMLAKLWNYKRWFTYGVVVILSLTVLVTNFTRSTQMVKSYHEVGRGYASAREHMSETYAYLRNRPDIPIFSNAFAGIYFWTGRVTDPIPSPSEIAAMKEKMKQTGAFLVIFDSIPVELYGTTREELTQGLVEQIRLSEATIYRSP
jgi:4-amino-4-deoxy-L-arabinose transferase-like glycosyltransferase